MVEQLRLEQVETPEFLDTFYTVLANATRRNALQYLLTHRDPVTVHRLALELAAVERGVPGEDVTGEQQGELALLLNHIHLPALSDAGIIEWDRTAELVSLTPLLDQLSVTTPDPSGLPGLSVSARSETSH
ncbi:DUF7344 domain-containing protein [Natronorubrum sp. FCH18a]|uniref:DUF7344 domain-containing protein n=1 Tax=Natronorubrum sp. FCH18a TaxID=3447018 RepID=UPI003F515A1E